MRQSRIVWQCVGQQQVRLVKAQSFYRCGLLPAVRQLQPSMNQEERTADKFLRALAQATPQFEPEGYKLPPDFKLPPAIGIEVRRLNQNFFDGSDATGLEELEIPLHAIFKRVLESFDNQFAGRTYWVGITYKRPMICSMKDVGRHMTKTLERFLQNPGQAPCHLQVNSNIDFEIRPSESPYRTAHSVVPSPPTMT